MQQSGAMPDIEGFLCACLRGEQPAWPFGQDKDRVVSFIEHANFHGVLPLLHHVLNQEFALNRGWPPEVLKAGRECAVAQAMLELHHRHLLAQALKALNAAGIRPVLFKGTVLAYTLYPSPASRPRADADLIIAPQDRFQVAAILKANGFSGQTVSCEFLSYEASFIHSGTRCSLMLDVHWRIHYSQLQSRLFPYEDMLQRAKRLPRLCPEALGVDPVYALLIACLHRANDLRIPQWQDGVPSLGQERLLALYDFHLLVESMDPEQLEEFTTLAVQKGLREICQEGIEKARACFNTRLPESMAAAFSKAGPVEPVILYQSSGMLRQRWVDWLALEGARNRIAYLWEHVSPPAEYMHTRFPGVSPKWLPLLYFRRLTEGKWRHIRSKRT